MSGRQHWEDVQEIRQVIDAWALWRDSGQWDRLESLWHPNGRMVATWFESTGLEFVAKSRAAFNSSTRVLHAMGATNIEIAADRAIAETGMQITQRAAVHDVLVDVECKGRFWDALIKVDGRWQIVLRQPIYELDRMTPVDPSASVKLDPNLLSSFPEGYRHLGYLQTQLGLRVSRNLPGTRGPEMLALNERGRRWLQGSSFESLFGNERSVSSAASTGAIYSRPEASSRA